jgi:protein-tyrosine phosphatase
LDGRDQNLRLFVGGLDTQSNHRPDVSTVFNLSEDASLWTVSEPAHPGDRWEQKGEGSHGMTARELAKEADWVINLLKAGERVLVHCSAGMNRSSSLCCAVLILLEGLSAEAALERVREHHPWARPDPRYWLKLRWLATASTSGLLTG